MALSGSLSKSRFDTKCGRDAPIIDKTPFVESMKSVRSFSRSSRSSLGPNGRKVSAAIVVMVVFGASMFILLSSTGPSAARLYHDPIYIVGDAELEASDAVSGSGTDSDPYVISGWEICFYTGAGISIQDTTAHLVIRDVHVNSTSDGMLQPAINLCNVSNATIENSLINWTTDGIVVTESDNVTISDVDFESCLGWMIDVSYSEHITVMDSTFYGQTGFRGTYVSEVVVMSNQMRWVEMGVSMTAVDNATVQDNSFWNCERAVSLGTAYACRVVGNSVNNSWYGVVLDWASQCNVSGNIIHEMDVTGIWSYGDSHDNTIFSNIISNCSMTGLLIEYTTDCTVTYNTFRNNSDDFWNCAGGVWLRESTGMLVHHNGFYDNVPRHAFDEGGGNWWNAAYPVGGNYWDNYTGDDLYSGVDQDAGPPDGFGDEPYWFDGDTCDNYPLYGATTANTRPVASFTITPGIADAGDEFSVDASGCSDAEDSLGDLQVRWDWDGDGTWDTSYSTDKTGTHAYLVPGNYTVRMEVMDTGGLTNVSSEDVEVWGTVIPEFTSLVVPVLAVMALFLVVSRRRSR